MIEKHEIEGIEVIERKILICGTIQNLHCSICNRDMEVDERVKILNCTHIFHKDCLGPWVFINNTCPNCRKLIE